jgi:hypothetical protein
VVQGLGEWSQGVEEMVEMLVANATEVVHGKGEKEYFFRIEFGNDIWVHTNENDVPWL